MDNNYIESLKIRLQKLESEVAALRADLEEALAAQPVAAPIAASDDDVVDIPDFIITPGASPEPVPEPVEGPAAEPEPEPEPLELPLPEEEPDLPEAGPEPEADLPEASAEPVADQPEPVFDPAPVAEAEPVVEPEPVAEAEPVAEPAPMPVAEPASAAVSVPEPVEEPVEGKPRGKSLVDLAAEKLAWKSDFPGIRVKNIRSAISLIDRAQFIAKLFNEDYNLYDSTISALNEVETLDEAVRYVTGNFPDWDLKSDIVYSFMMAIRKKLG